MELTDGEKLILFMLCDISSKKKQMNPALICHAIENEQLWAIQWDHGFIPFKPCATPPLVNNVIEILDMWMAIETSFEKLNFSEKERVKASVKGLPGKPYFPGFDGNKEREQVVIMGFLIKNLRRFSMFSNRPYLDTSKTAIPRYTRMLASWQGIKSTNGNSHISPQNMIELLNS